MSTTFETDVSVRTPEAYREQADVADQQHQKALVPAFGGMGGFFNVRIDCLPISS
jgi:hypothetical protein